MDKKPNLGVIVVVSMSVGLVTGAAVTWLATRRNKRRGKIFDIPLHDFNTGAENEPPLPLEKHPSTAALYHSGQAGLFTEKAKEMAQRVDRDDYVINDIQMHHVSNLREWMPNLKDHQNSFFRTRHGTTGLRGYNVDIDEGQLVLADLIRNPGNHSAVGFIRAGPRGKVVFHSKNVRAAVVTCGGLCPGLNDVIYEIVQTLYYNYSVDVIYGVRGGYRGFYDPNIPFVDLTPSSTTNIHKRGGTILGSSRGGFDKDKIMQAIQEHGINQLFVIGGDGTHRGANILSNTAKERGIVLTVVGVPKTIDNDIGLIDRSFGFNTAVEEAVRAIDSARIEAECIPNGIGIVKLMGRQAGFIAAHATLADRNVNLCLIPEIPVNLEEVFGHIERTLKSRGSCVIVVAEGAGENLLTGSSEVDPSGNKVLPPIGEFLKKEIKKYFAEQKNIAVNIKYNDPSYMIRSVPANAADSILCMILAQNAVHGAMAGFTGFTSALVNNRTCYIPMDLIEKTSPTILRPNGRTWERVTHSTHQPYMANK